MKTIERIDATDSLAMYAEQTPDFPIVITDHGQPIAALLSVPNADLETVSLSTNPQFLSLISRSRLASGGTRRHIERGNATAFFFFFFFVLWPAKPLFSRHRVTYDPLAFDDPHLIERKHRFLSRSLARTAERKTW